MYKIYSIDEVLNQLNNLNYVIDAFLFNKFCDNFKKFTHFDLKNCKVVFFKDSINITRKDNGYTCSFENYKNGKFIIIDFNYWMIK